MSKRKFGEYPTTQISRKYQKRQGDKKHSLDSDEEDFNDDADNVLDENEIEGEEEGESARLAEDEDEQRMTAFNMQEEMELGHFDKQGHFIWKNEKEVRDNWLDNIDWHQINKNAKFTETNGEDDSDTEIGESFDEIQTYKSILTYMKPKESVDKSLRRLGGNTEKLSSIERLRRKKAGTLNSNKEVTDLTELANKVLNNTGNMDVYQETYEQISDKIERYNRKCKSKKAEPELDMYADDFDDREKQKLSEFNDDGTDEVKKELMWEFKWEQGGDKIEGPYATEQMLKWANEGYFKTGVWVRKSGEDSNFYTSNRIDFDLYL